jgi:hypothetical protein
VVDTQWCRLRGLPRSAKRTIAGPFTQHRLVHVDLKSQAVVPAVVTADCGCCSGIRGRCCRIGDRHGHATL